jgi:4-amino-4-deoxy-L-arabinose transferase-like glycosyltransferase
MFKKNIFSKEKQPFFVFLFFVILILFNHSYGYFGHYGYDDMLYAKISEAFVHGNTMFDESFSYRFPIILLTSFSYLIFGVSDFSSSLPPLLISISILFVVYISLRKFGTFQTIIGLAFTTLINIFLFYSDKIMPDIYVAFLLLLSIYWIDRYKFYVKKNELLYSFLFVVSLFLAFASKETAVLFLPLLILLFLSDFYQKRNQKFWIYSVFIGIGILVLYLLVIWLLTGNLFKRVEVLSMAHQIQIYKYSYDTQPVIILVKRLFFDLFKLYTTEGVFISMIFTLPIIFSKRFKEIVKINDTASLYLFSSFILLLSSNFMTISPFSYHPVPADVRHTLFLIPINAIAASFAVKDFLLEKTKKYQIIICLILFSALSYFLQKNIFYDLYLPLTILSITLILIKIKIHYLKIIFSICLVIILSITPYKFFVYSSTNVNYNLQKEIVFNHFVKPNEKCYVFTDPMQKNIGNYYLEFDTSKNCKFVDYTDFKTEHFESYFKKYLLLNWHTQFYSNSLDNLPDFVKKIESTYYLKFQNKKHGIFIYELTNLPQK